MLSIRHSDIPNFLHGGGFYQSLSDDDPEAEIQVPTECFSLLTPIEGLADFRLMLRVTTFWVLDNIPITIIDYCNERSFELWSETAFEVLGESELWKVLHQVFNQYNEEGYYGALIEAIKLGRTDIVSVLIETATEDGEAAIEASRLGRLDYLILLHEHGHFWDKLACNEAAGEAHLECLQYLHTQGCPWDHEVYVYAGRKGHLDCFKYIHQQGLEWHEYVSWEIAKMGRLEVLKYALDHGCPCDVRAVKFAVLGGYVECVRSLLQHGCPVDTEACTNAASGGQIECLRLLCEYGAPLHADVAANAANYNQLGCLQYLHQAGCPWDERVPDSAAFRGNLTMLRFALDHGCPHNSSDLTFRAAGCANSTNSLACLQYLIDEQGMYMNEDGSVFVEAFVRGHVQCVTYLIDVGCPCNVTSDFARSRWSEMGINPSRKSAITASQQQELLDQNVAKCIEYAIEHSWDIETQGAELLKHIRFNRTLFPLSCAQCQGLKMLAQEPSVAERKKKKRKRSWW